MSNFSLVNTVAEQQVVSACLNDGDMINTMVDIIGPSDFSNPKLGSIFASICRVALVGKVTPADVVEDLRISQELEQVGDSKAISYLLNINAPIENAKDNAKILRELSKKRDQAATARRVADTISSGGDPSDDLNKFTQSQSEEDTDGWADLGGIVENIFNGTHTKLEPSLLKRDDGNCLLYEARLNMVAAPPESAKSWLSKYTAVQCMLQGKVTVYLDCEESTAETCAERMVSIARGLGVSDETLKSWTSGPLMEDGSRDMSKRLFFYRAMPQGITSKSRAQVLRLVRERNVTFLVLDGLAAAMSAANLEEDRAKDVNMFLNAHIWAFVQAGAGVLVVDHVTKSSGGQHNTRFQNASPRGSGAKLAAVSGAAIMVNATVPGSAWTDGRYEIYVVKDRPGRIKISNRSGKRLAGVLITQPSIVDGIEMSKLTVLSPEAAADEQAEKRWDLIAAELISKLLNDLHLPLGKTEIKDMLNQSRKSKGGSGWRGDTLVKAIDFLISNNYVKVEKDGRTEKLSKLVMYKAEYGAIHADEAISFESPF